MEEVNVGLTALEKANAMVVLKTNARQETQRWARRRQT